jgi:hypothetical protein
MLLPIHEALVDGCTELQDLDRAPLHLLVVMPFGTTSILTGMNDEMTGLLLLETIVSDHSPQVWEEGTSLVPSLSPMGVVLCHTRLIVMHHENDPHRAEQTIVLNLYL